MTKKELIEKLEALGLPTDGNKKELEARLKAADTSTETESPKPKPESREALEMELEDLENQLANMRAASQHRTPTIATRIGEIKKLLNK